MEEDRINFSFEQRSTETGGNLFKPYNKGIFKQNILSLVEDKRRLLSVSEVMQRRIDVLGTNKEVEEFWVKIPIVTDDMAFYDGRGELKIVLDLADFWNKEVFKQFDSYWGLNETQIIKDNFNLEGKTFSSKKYFQKYDSDMGYGTTKNVTMQNPILNYLSRNKRLLEDYFDFLLFFRDKKRLTWNDTALPLRINNPNHFNAVHPFIVGNIDINNRSEIEAPINVEYDKMPLVGILKDYKYQSVSKEFKSYSIQERKQLSKLFNFIKPILNEEYISLLKKL